MRSFNTAANVQQTGKSVEWLPSQTFFFVGDQGRSNVHA